MHSEGGDPCDDTLEGNHPHSPSRPILPLDGSDRRDAGRIEQAEGQEGECHARCQDRRESFLRPVEDRQGRDDTLLGHESGDERRRKLPVCKTERCKERRDSAGKEGEDTVLGIRHHIETDIKVLQEPDDDGADEDDRECTLEKISGLIPHETQDIFHTGHTVIRKLHDKGHRFPSEKSTLEEESGQDRHADTEEIKPDHDERPISRKECRRKEGIDRYLGRAAHERDEHDGHASITLRGQRPRRHDSRYAAAETDKERHNAASGETQLSEQPIHDEGDTGHIAPVFQKRQEEKQDDDHRHEGNNAAYALKNSIHHQRADGWIHRLCREPGIHPLCHLIDAVRQSVLQESTDDIKGEEEDQSHDQDEDRDGGVLSREDAVDLLAARMLFAFLRLHHRPFTETADEEEAHIRHRSRTVKTALFFKLRENVPQKLFLIGLQSERLLHERIPLDQLGCCEP